MIQIFFELRESHRGRKILIITRRKNKFMNEVLEYKQRLENEYDIKIFTDNIELECLKQTEELLEQKAFKDCKIRLMPDTHAGKGAVIGFTADLGNKIIPNIVGVDIGCGISCITLGKIDINLKWLDEGIYKEVPSGRECFEDTRTKFELMKELKCWRELKDSKKFNRQIGTLGGGNHFLEIDEDEKGTKYLLIHTGSRNLGMQVANYYQTLAVKLCSGWDKLFEKQNEIIKTYKEQGRKSEIQEAIKELHRNFKQLKPKLPLDLCYLEGKYSEEYLYDMKICQEYAVLNRETIARNIIEKIINPQLKEQLIYDELDKFESVHNYINFNDNIIRKGAISAYKDEKVIIPINMRDGCIIGVGKENEDWNYSAPHGAGRVMSRSKAKELLNMDKYIDDMKNIYTTSVNLNTIDEAPEAYKTMDEIIDNIKDTVDIVTIIKF